MNSRPYEQYPRDKSLDALSTYHGSCEKSNLACGAFDAYIVLGDALFSPRLLGLEIDPAVAARYRILNE